MVLRVSSIQLAVRETKQANLDRAAEMVLQAGGADLVLLPELWHIGFMRFDRYILDAEEKDGPTMSLMRRLAREAGCYLHTGSFVERNGDRLYNSSYLLSPDGEILANYRKIHLFGYDSQERQILTPGDSVTVVPTPIGTFGMATCYDLRFPELFRQMVDRGSEFFLVTSAWPYPREAHWRLFNQVRALENQCFLASANSTGPNGSGVFLGQSMIVDPWGVIRAEAPADREAVITAEVDMGEVSAIRDTFPALRDRRLPS